MTLLAAPLFDPPAVGDAPIDAPAVLNRARAAQGDWARSPLRRRLAVIRRARRLMVDRADALAATVTHPHRRNDAETLGSEVMPLVEAARYLERRAHRILRGRSPRAGRPMIGRDLRMTVTRDPWGVVLVIGPANYPLMLPGVQVLQALVAGNGVLFKPGRRGATSAEALRGLLVDAGLPADLLHVLDEQPHAAHAAIDAGVDHIVLTGSEGAGRSVADAAARTLTPLTAELGGHDAALVLDDADLDLTTRALVFGLTSNRGATCIAPRRLYARPQTARQLEQRLATALPPIDPGPLTADQTRRLHDAVAEALQRGARLLPPSAHERHAAGSGQPHAEAGRQPPAHATDAPAGRATLEAEIADSALQISNPKSRITDFKSPTSAPPSGTPDRQSEINDQQSAIPDDAFPLVLTNVPPDARLMHEDLFSPVLAICAVDSIDEAVRQVNACRHRLGASVFGPPAAGRALADRLDVGCVTINDLIAPVGDPRLPLAGRGASGFGVTRGDEGLLAMTRVKASAERSGKWRPHYDPPDAAAAQRLRGYLDFAHGRSLRQRLAGLRRLLRAIRGGS